MKLLSNFGMGFHTFKQELRINATAVYLFYDGTCLLCKLAKSVSYYTWFCLV